MPVRVQRQQPSDRRWAAHPAQTARRFVKGGASRRERATTASRSAGPAARPHCSSPAAKRSTAWTVLTAVFTFRATVDCRIEP